VTCFTGRDDESAVVMAGFLNFSRPVDIPPATNVVNFNYQYFVRGKEAG